MTDQISTEIEEQSVVTLDVSKNVVDVGQKFMGITTGANQTAVTANSKPNWQLLCKILLEFIRSNQSILHKIIFIEITIR